MQVRIEDVSPVEKRLIVSVPWDTVSSKLAEAYRELAKGVQLRGFRKGKVPRTVLQQMFGRRVQAEVASQLVRESFLSAASEHNLQAVAEPKVEKELVIKRGEPFSFEAVVEVKGAVEAVDFAGMELSSRSVEVSEEQIEQAIDALRHEHIELIPIEGRDVTARTDVLSIAVKGALDGIEIDRPQLAVDLGDPEGGLLPGLVPALLNLPVDVRDHHFELAIPADYADTNIAGKTAKLSVTITDARQKRVPDLDDEFAKDTGKAETVAELREVVRQELEKRQREQIQAELREAALRELVKRNQIPVAASLVERAMEMKVDRLRRLFGISPGTGEEPEAGMPEDLRAKLRPQALEEVRGQLLLDAVGEREGTEVTAAEVDGYIAKLAEARGIAAARLRAELDRDGRLDNIRFSLRQDKTLDLILSRATIKLDDKQSADETPGTEESAEHVQGAGEFKQEGGEIAPEAREQAKRE